MPNDLLRLLASRRARNALYDALARSFTRRGPPRAAFGLLRYLAARRGASRSPAGPSAALRLARRALRAAGRGAVALLCTFATWALANVASRRPVPPAPWSRAELLADPPPDQNGWQLARESDARVQLPREIAALFAGDPSELWQRALEARPALERFVDEAPSRRALVHYKIALARPRFADARAPEQPGGGHLRLYEMHRVGEARALLDASRGELEASFDLTSAMLRADLDYAATARSPLARLAASAQLKGTLATSEALLDALDALKQKGAGGSTAGPTPPPYAKAAELATLLKRLSPGHFDLRRAIISENLFARSMLLESSDGGGVVRAPFSSLFFDRGSTIERLDARHREIMARASAPPGGVPLAAPERAQDEFGWWLINPVGDLALDALASDWASVIAKANAARDASLAERDALLQRLAGG